MKALGVFEAGAPENLRIIELPDPHPAASEVVIKTAFAGVNYGDVIRRKRGLFPKDKESPYVLGFEGAGIVYQAGEGTSLKEGERVAFFVESGGYAQLVRVNEAYVSRIPESVSLEVAAGATCVGTTAWHILNLAALKPGCKVIVHGGAGGVGSALLQFGREFGLRQLATVGSSEEKARYAKGLGADEVVVRSRENFAARAMEFGAETGVDAIFDCIGAEVVEDNLKVLKSGGMLVYYGSTSGHPNFPGGTVLMKGLRIQGFVIFDVMYDKSRWRKGADAVFEALASKKYSINIEKVVPMENAREAHELLEARQVIGKVVVDMS